MPIKQKLETTNTTGPTEERVKCRLIMMRIESTLSVDDVIYLICVFN